MSPTTGVRVCLETRRSGRASDPDPGSKTYISSFISEANIYLYARSSRRDASFCAAGDGPGGQREGEPPLLQVYALECLVMLVG